MTRLKGNKQKVLIAVILIAGLLVLFYPVYSNFVNQLYAKKMITHYQGTSKKVSKEKKDKLFEQALIYNKRLVYESVPSSFAKRVGIKHDKKYEDLLNITGDGIMGYIEIPSIHVHLPIYHYTTNNILKKGAGHLFGSSLPTGGKNTHAVITAHRGLPSAKMFTDLDQLRIGDRFYFEVLGQKIAYQVDKTKTIKPNDTSELGISRGRDLATLVTCTPYGQNTHRLIVRGHRVPYHEGEEKQQPIHHKVPWKHILCLAIGVAIAIVIYMIIRKRRKQ